MDLDYFLDDNLDLEDEVIKDGLEKVQLLKDTIYRVHQILIIGDIQSYKSSLSILLAKKLEYQHTKVLSNIDMIKMNESEKVKFISDEFDIAHTYKTSCLIIDSLETILEYHRDLKSGKLRFMSSLLNTIKTLLRKKPVTKENCLLVIINSIKMPGLDLDEYIDDYIILN